MGDYITAHDASTLTFLAVVSMADKTAARMVWPTLTFDRLLARSAGELLVRSTRTWPKRRTPASRLAEAYMLEAKKVVPSKRSVTARMRLAMRGLIQYKLHNCDHG